MAPRELQTAILAGPLSGDCAPLVHTNEMPKIYGAEQPLTANGSNTVNFPAWDVEIADPT